MHKPLLSLSNFLVTGVVYIYFFRAAHCGSVFSLILPLEKSIQCSAAERFLFSGRNASSCEAASDINHRASSFFSCKVC